jgi:3-oxoacyl-[acyl-carrier protein] reductase
VVIADINEEGAKQTAADMQKQGMKAVGLGVDITKSEQVDRMVQSVVDQFGRIDVLVNNAGVVSNIPVLEFPEAEWNKTIAVNLTGVFLCSQRVGRVMVNQRSGRIINISSLSGRVGVPGQAAYCASKFGVLGLTQVLAIDLAPHVTCNAICPGMNETEMMPKVIEQRAASRGQTVEEVRQGILCKTPLGRFGQPEDVGRVVLFYASPLANYVTGQFIDVDGGRRANLS